MVRAKEILGVAALGLSGFVKAKACTPVLPPVGAVLASLISPHCCEYALANRGDTCETLEVKAGITAGELVALNPILSISGCTVFALTTYCVQGVPAANVNPVVTSVVGNVVPVVTSVVGNVVPVVTSVVGNVVPVVTSVVGNVVPVVNSVVGSVVPVVTSIVDNVVPIVTSLVGNVVPVVPIIVGNVPGAAKVSVPVTLPRATLSGGVVPTGTRSGGIVPGVNSGIPVNPSGQSIPPNTPFLVSFQTAPAKVSSTGKGATVTEFLILNANGTVSLTTNCSDAVAFSVTPDGRLTVNGLFAFLTPAQLPTGFAELTFGPNKAMNTKTVFSTAGGVLTWSNPAFLLGQAIFGIPTSLNGVVVLSWKSALPAGYLGITLNVFTRSSPLAIAAGCPGASVSSFATLGGNTGTVGTAPTVPTSTVFKTIIDTIIACPSGIVSCSAGQGTTQGSLGLANTTNFPDTTQGSLGSANTTIILSKFTGALSIESTNAGSSPIGILSGTVVLASCFALAIALL